MLTADLDRLGLRAGDRVLDLGCGFGRHAFEVARRGGRVVALDAGADEVRSVVGILAAMVAAGELPDEGGHAGAVQGDAWHLPFAEGTFDRVICAEVLEHLPDDVAALAEIARVLRPGGTLAVTVPRFAPELVNWALSDEYHLVPGGHVRIYRRRILEARLAASGLAVDGHGFAHGLHSPYWALKCLVGVSNDDHWLVHAYHRLLVWDIERRPVVTRLAERVLAPVMGKSLVVYATRQP